MIIHCEIKQGQLIPESTVLWKDYLQKNEGKRVKVEITRIFRRRSNDQNEYLWGVVYHLMSLRLSELTGEEVTPEDVHYQMKEKFSSKKTDVENPATGDVDSVLVIQSTSDKSTVEFMAYVDKLRDLSAKFLGIYIPGPNELFHSENQGGLE